jgi:hypothetical protein
MASPTHESEESDIDEIEAETVKRKVRSSKLILCAMAIVFGVLSWNTPEVNQFHTAFSMIAVIATYHLVFHIWCDCDDLRQLYSRHEYHVYLVMFSNLLLISVLIPANTVFTRALGILVMPVAFCREVKEMKQMVTFLVLHAALVVNYFRHDLQGEGIQWLGNLVLVDVMIVDHTALRMKAIELGSLLKLAYMSSQDMANVMLQHLLRSLSEAFVIVDAEATLLENSPTLSAMLGRTQNNKDMPFRDFVDYDDREEFQNHMMAWSASDLPEGGPKDSTDSVIATSLKVLLQRGDGRTVPCLLFFAKLWSPDGEYIYFIGVCDAWQETKKKKIQKRCRHGHRTQIQD